MTDFFMKCITGMKWVKFKKQDLKLTEDGGLEDSDF